MTEKEIRFNPKRVDESWKEHVSTEKAGQTKRAPESSEGFSTFIRSLAMQGLIHLGLIPAPGGEPSEVNLEAAQELINLLVMLKEKTEGNRSPEEEKLTTSLISDLQLKFVSIRQGLG